MHREERDPEESCNVQQLSSQEYGFCITQLFSYWHGDKQDTLFFKWLKPHMVEVQWGGQDEHMEWKSVKKICFWDKVGFFQYYLIF